MSNFKIFVIGYSECGKTTLTKALGEKFNLKFIGGSQWTKRFGIEKTEPNYREIVTQKVIEHLAEFPFTNVNFIERELSTIHPVLIEGLRNPFDFMNLFSPATDYVIHLNPIGSNPSNEFDKGVDGIIANIKWLISTGLMEPFRFFQESGHDLTSTKDIADKYSFDPKAQKLTKEE